MPHHETTVRYLPVSRLKIASYQSLKDSTYLSSSAVIPTCNLTERSGGFELWMLAVWECRLETPVPICFYLDLTFSFVICPTTSRKLLSAFETRIIHKRKSLRDVTSCNPHQREEHFKHLSALN